MDNIDARVASVTYPPIPIDGLSEVLRHWIGRGELWPALALPSSEEHERDWSSHDLKSRSDRILFERLRPQLREWPSRQSHWENILPAARDHTRTIEAVPFSGVSWVNTRILYGWPPKKYFGRVNERSADMAIVTTLKWILDELARVASAATTLSAEADLLVRPQLEAARAIHCIDPIFSAVGIRPSHKELVAIKREGGPWGAISRVAEELLAAQTSIDHLVSSLLIPDEEIRWRLYHLAVLGTLITSLQKSGCSLKSIRSISASSSGPIYSVRGSGNDHWDLWFEASGIWSYFDQRSPYAEASAGLNGITKSLGADLVLIKEGEAALILECKYSSSREIVGRNGYYQAMTYAAEARSRLVPAVTSFAIGPEGVVAKASSTDTLVGKIGTAPPTAIHEIVRDFLSIHASGTLNSKTVAKSRSETLDLPQ